MIKVIGIAALLPAPGCGIVAQSGSAPGNEAGEHRMMVINAILSFRADLFEAGIWVDTASIAAHFPGEVPWQALDRRFLDRALGPDEIGVRLRAGDWTLRVGRMTHEREADQRAGEYAVLLAVGRGRWAEIHHYRVEYTSNFATVLEFRMGDRVHGTPPPPPPPPAPVPDGRGR